MKWDIQSKIEKKDISEKKDLDIIDKLLDVRGVDTKEKKSDFINPPPIFKMLKDLPEDFKSLAKNAVALIEEKIKDKKPIIIHGDYDVDGVCATAILVRAIRDDLGYENVFYFIPNRFEHGYGLSEGSVDACKLILEKSGESDHLVEGSLLITVDSGITSVREVDYAKSLGFDVVITDHHQKPDKLPCTDFIIWTDKVVGAGIAWILAKLLRSKDKRLLGLASLATVADLQPLYEYNRSIVKEGLKVLRCDPLPGILALAEVAGMDVKKITTYDLGWVLGPRINASGRMADGTRALLLLLEDDFEKALEYASWLDKTNTQRQDETQKMYELALENSVGNATEIPRVIVTVSKEYHEGIIGLMASKLTQKYNRPSIVISLKDGIGKGSVRSVPGVDIIKFLREIDDIFENVGGHPMAAGFTIKEGDIKSFSKKVEELSKVYVKDKYLKPVLKVDLEMPVSFVDKDFLNKLDTLKPFGIGNKTPIFVSRNLGVMRIDLVGKENSHLSLDLLDPDLNKKYKAIFFNGSEYINKMGLGDKIDIAYNIKENNFKGRSYVNLILKDLKKSDD